jgi:hypothetical protein
LPVGAARYQFLGFLAEDGMLADIALDRRTLSKGGVMVGAKLAITVVAVLLETNGEFRSKMSRQYVRVTAPSEWALEWAELDGARFERDQFGGGHLSLSRNGDGELDLGSLGPYKLSELSYPLEPAGRHPQIDLWLRPLLVTKPTFGFQVIGIYRFDCDRLDSDRLLLCITDVGKDRPTGFVTKPKDGRLLLAFKRKR